MSQQNISWAPFIFGGIFLGAWLYGILFGFPGWTDFQPGQWVLWGFVGLVIAGGLYAARVTEDWVRIIVIVVVGIALGLLILATFLEEEAHIIGSFLTAAGAGLIVAALPRFGAGRDGWEEVPDHPSQGRPTQQKRPAKK